MSHEEKRVRLDVYGACPPELRRIVPSFTGDGKARTCRLHVLAAERFAELARAVEAACVLAPGERLEIVSGYRPQRWATREAYEAAMVRRYSKRDDGTTRTREQAIAEGSKWVAFKSPHTTGLAVDFGVGGLWPARRTAADQRKTPLHAWLVAHAWEHGWHPYKREPWHWECPVSLEEFRSGVRVG